MVSLFHFIATFYGIEIDQSFFSAIILSERKACAQFLLKNQTYK